jgi:hypothetical protein
MDEISTLREAFSQDEVPSQAVENRARVALHQRTTATARSVTGTGRHRRTRFAISSGVAVAAAAAVIAGVAVTRAGSQDHPTPPGAVGRAGPSSASALPFPRPVSAPQYLVNAAWTAERKPWTDPRPDQFMYIETLELRNTPAYENRYPNAAIRPGLAQNRKVQAWYSVDGQIEATYQNGKLVVTTRGQNHEFFDRIPWSTITAMDSPEKVKDDVMAPVGSYGVTLDAFIGQYVVPPNVQAAIFRHLARDPGMTINPDAVNIDGHPAIGLGRILEGYLSQELLFDKQTYAFIGERLVAIKDHVTHGDDMDLVSHKGDVFRQVVYAKMIIVDHAGDTR